MTLMRCRFRNIQTALVDFGLPARRRYSERPPRYEYILTETGRDFRPVIVAMFTSLRIFS